MANEAHDPWALLREARKFVVDAERLWIEWDNDQEERAVVSMLARIDAALAEGCPDCGHQYGQQEYCQGDGHAEHADSATPVVESEVKWHRTLKGSTFFVAHLNDADMALRVDWDRWYWKVTREGHTNTLDEAKSAAIRAARGM